MTPYYSDDAEESELKRLRAFVDAFESVAYELFGCNHFHDAMCARCAWLAPVKVAWARVCLPLPIEGLPEETPQ